MTAVAQAHTLEAEGALAVLIAHARRQRPQGSDRELVARAIARLALQLSASRPVKQEATPDEEVAAVAAVGETRYEDLVEQMRELVSRAVPVGRRVAIVTRGDGNLLLIPGRDGRHFPSTRDGRYAGFYPADGNAALAQLNDAIHSGVSYLAIPESGRWWLDFYTEFGAFLRSECRAVVDDLGVGAVFELAPSTQESN